MDSGGARFRIVCVLNTVHRLMIIIIWDPQHTTIPNTGFSARLAMPVLKDRDVMSRMAVPVVSEPVPAVVGTAIRGRRV